MAGLTPFQTVGPFLSIGLRAGLVPMASSEAGAPITIAGTLIDGQGEGVGDGVLEFWHPAFDGIGRVQTGADGGFVLQTRKPGPLPGPAGAEQAPHFAVRVLARGILTEFLTRVYFDDEPSNTADPILALVPAGRRETLIARSTGASEYRFDVILQGSNETVFFDV